VAAILNDGVKVYDRYARSPMSEWIERDRNGHADPVRLRSKIEARARMNLGARGILPAHKGEDRQAASPLLTDVAPLMQ
jgi:hypothetical protein